jgi:hypothetical protein
VGQPLEELELEEFLELVQQQELVLELEVR